MACTARRKALPSPGCYLQFDQERASDPRSRRSASSRFYDAGKFLWWRLFRPRGAPFQDVGPVAGAVHPGLEPAIRGAFSARAPGDILSAKAPVVAVATEALAWTFVAALGISPSLRPWG
jgi:hypothetical protein